MASEEARPAYVRFDRRGVEDKARSTQEGRYIAKDVDFVLITPPFTRDVMEMKVASWLELIRSQADRGDIKREWYDQYVKALDAWRAGEELPLIGTAIKGWGVISPAQQQTLIRMMILTVEDLAAANEEGVRRIGMGGSELVSKAKTWLAQLNDKGPLTIQVAALQKKIEALESENLDLTNRCTGLREQCDVYERQAGLMANFQHLQPTGNVMPQRIIEEEEEVVVTPVQSRKVRLNLNAS